MRGFRGDADRGIDRETDIDSVLFENPLEGGSYPGLTFRGCKFVAADFPAARWNARRGLTACWSNATYQHADDQGDDAANKADRLQTRWHLINRGIPARFFDRALRRASTALRLHAPREADGLGLLSAALSGCTLGTTSLSRCLACPRGALWDAVPRHGSIG